MPSQQLPVGGDRHPTDDWFGWRGGWGSSAALPRPASEWRWSAAAPRCTWPSATPRCARYRPGTHRCLPASEHALHRGYDRILVVSRSGTTTEVVDVLRAMPAGVATPDHRSAAPGRAAAEQVVVLDEVDERSVVQTRFATTTLALLRAQLGHDWGRSPSRAARHCAPRCRRRSSRPTAHLPRPGVDDGLAHEAALKLRESAQLWTESYRRWSTGTADQHRRARRVTWAFGELPDGLEEQVSRPERTWSTPRGPDGRPAAGAPAVSGGRRPAPPRPGPPAQSHPVRHPGLMRSVGGSPAR